MNTFNEQRPMARWKGWLGAAGIGLLGLVGCGGGGGGDEDGGGGTPAEHAVGGSVSGLTSSVTLRNGSESLTRSANGAFTFANPVKEGSSYAVTVGTQPSGQTCAVANGSGTVGKADVTNVEVTCTTTGGPTTYSIGSTVSGLAGSVTLANGITLTETVTVSANGSFTFPTRVANGGAYAVMVTTQPSGQTCSVVNGSGSVASASVTNISVACVGSTANAETRSWTAGVALEPTSDSQAVTFRSAGIADDGRVVALYTQNNGSRTALYAVHGSPGGAGAAPTWQARINIDDSARLAPIGVSDAPPPRVAVAPNGNAVAVWITPGTCNASTYVIGARVGGCDRLIARRYLAASQSWEAAVEVIDTPASSSHPLIPHINDQGDVVIGYNGWVRNNTTGWSDRMAVAWRSGSAGGSYTLKTFTEWGLGSSALFPPVLVQDIDVGLTKAGGIVVAGQVWQGAPSSYTAVRDIVAYRGNVADTDLTGGVIDTRTDGTSDFRMKVGRESQAVLQWTQSDGTRSAALHVATAASGTADWAVRSLGENAPSESESPALVVSDSGTAFLFRSCLFKSWTAAGGWAAEWTAMPTTCARVVSVRQTHLPEAWRG